VLVGCGLLEFSGEGWNAFYVCLAEGEVDQDLRPLNGSWFVIYLGETRCSVGL
jgi:hypothetical protein